MHIAPWKVSKASKGSASHSMMVSFARGLGVSRVNERDSYSQSPTLQQASSSYCRGRGIPSISMGEGSQNGKTERKVEQADSGN